MTGAGDRGPPAAPAGRILIVGADPSLAATLTALLEPGSQVVSSLASAADLTAALLRELAPDLALVAPGAAPDASRAVAGLRAEAPGMAVVVVVPVDRRPEGAAARAHGAYAFLEIPGDLTVEKVQTTIANALERERLVRELAAARGAASLNLFGREGAAIEAALTATRWNKQAAARLLGLHRPTLYAKMRKHGIPPRRPT